VGTKFHLPKTKNKGGVGMLLEKLTGIPTSSACLDCIDGEVKAYPMKRLKRNGMLVPKETVAITMMHAENLPDELWEDARLKKKIENILFVAYEREGDDVTFMFMQHLQQSDASCAEYYQQFEADFNSIKDMQVQTGRVSGSCGKLIQSRTKGKGGPTAPKTRAYYFRKDILSTLPHID